MTMSSECDGCNSANSEDGARVASRHHPRDPRSAAKYNFLSRLFLIWLDPLFWQGYHHPLEQKDIFVHPREGDSKKLLHRFDRLWKKEIERKHRGQNPRLLLAVMKCFWDKLLLQGLLQFFLVSPAQFFGPLWVGPDITNVAMYSFKNCYPSYWKINNIVGLVGQSVILGYLVDIFDDTAVCGKNSSNLNSEQFRSAYLYATGITVIAFLIPLLNGHGFLVAHKNGMISRIIMTGAIYKKIISLSQVAVGQLTVGHIVNLVSNDVQRLDLAFVFVHMFWIAPLHLVVVTYLIYLEIGWYTFIVTAIVCLLVPLQVFLARLFSYLRLKSAKLTDSRVRIMNEIITGIRVIKMYAWEYAFKKVVANLRKKESVLVLQAGLTRVVGVVLMVVFINVVNYVAFSSYSVNGGILSAKKVFTIISLLFGIHITSIFFLIQGILGVVEARVASIRIQKLLGMDDFVYHEQNRDSPGSAQISAINLGASWTDDESKLALCDVNFNMDQKDHLLAVIGPVGSSKSTLLLCLLNELQLTNGSLNVEGSISYASQDPWVFSATLRENIVFGAEFRREYYDQVLEACALDKDVKVLDKKDLTSVGERGVTLSGGQKARVNLARAVYRDADIYLLDDPLSAVDAGVGKHIFTRCIQKLLKDKLVVLVTHQVHFAILADKLLVLNDGKVEAYGSYADILAAGYDTTQLLDLVSNETQQCCAQGADLMRNQGVRRGHNILQSKPLDNDKTKSLDFPNRTPVSTPRMKNRKMISRDVYSTHFDSNSISSAPSMQSLHDLGNKVEESVSEPPEEKEQGILSTMVYVKYFQSGGTVATVIIFFIFLVGEVGLVASDWWLSSWAVCDTSKELLTSMPYENSTCSNSSSLCSLNTSDRLYIYTGITVASITVNFTRALAFLYLCVNASRVLHNKMFLAVIRSPVLFFDINPIGRILNRFSKDIGFLDDLLPYMFCEFLIYLFRCSAIFLTAVITNPWFIPPAVILLCGMLVVRWYSLKTSREIKRLEAVARSPVYSHVSTTLQGLPVIRAFRKQNAAISRFHDFQNEHTQSWYLYLVTTRWLGIRIDILSALFIFAFMFMSIGLVFFASDLSLVGVGLTYAITLSGRLQFTVRQSAEIENLMVSAERVKGYGNLEPEAPLENNDHQKPPDDWPDKGCLSFHNVSFQYSPDLPMVLHDISFSTKPSEKIGIVGRTGAGKSSLISVLYRLAEFVGQVTIDGIDIQTIGLHDLRKKMSIIPQDPVLFSGTVRYNLDPFDEYTNRDLWRALEQVQLSDFIEDMEGQLNSKILEGGGNFSVGQRQLVCLARALLRRNRILILDEATANVDPVTDRVIQDIIRDEFADCTVLTIAHRLNTIMDSDRILVLKDGQVKEFDTPLSLLENKSSLFTQMVEKTGVNNAHRLYQMAVEANRNSYLSSDIVLVSAV